MFCPNLQNQPPILQYRKTSSSPPLKIVKLVYYSWSFDFLRWKTTNLKSDFSIPSFLHDGHCDYGEFYSCSFHGRSHSYSNEILRWSKMDLEAYHMFLEDDATSIYHESLPSSPSVEKEPPPTITEWLFDSPSK